MLQWVQYTVILNCGKVFRNPYLPYNEDFTVQLLPVAACAYGLQDCSPPRVFTIWFFRIFYNVNIFCNVVVHTLFTNAPVYVAEKTNFPVLLALAK